MTRHRLRLPDQGPLLGLLGDGRRHLLFDHRLGDRIHILSPIDPLHRSSRVPVPVVHFLERFGGQGLCGGGGGGRSRGRDRLGRGLDYIHRGLRRFLHSRWGRFLRGFGIWSPRCCRILFVFVLPLESFGDGFSEGLGSLEAEVFEVVVSLFLLDVGLQRLGAGHSGFAGNWLSGGARGGDLVAQVVGGQAVLVPHVVCMSAGAKTFEETRHKPNMALCYEKSHFTETERQLYFPHVQLTHFLSHHNGAHSPGKQLMRLIFFNKILGPRLLRTRHRGSCSLWKLGSQADRQMRGFVSSFEKQQQC